MGFGLCKFLNERNIALKDLGVSMGYNAEKILLCIDQKQVQNTNLALEKTERLAQEHKS
jgi:hypothetical protein